MTEQRGDIAYMFSEKGKFGDIGKATDYLLPAIKNTDPSVTETWWFQFCIPERGLNGEIYFWVHSNLKMASGGVWIYQGVKKHHLLAEHFNFKNFLPYPIMDENGMSLPDLGLTIKVAEPLKAFDIRYEYGDTKLAFRSEAVAPVIMRSNDAHLEQPMHTYGDLILAGEKLRVDCMAMRDRSWGEPRREMSMDMPPTCWAVGISLDGKTAFNFSTSDDPERNPKVASFGMKKEALFRDGWLYQDEKLKKIVAASNLTARDEMCPLSYDCVMMDEDGRQIHVVGKVVASINWSPWPNMSAFFGNLTRWEMDGQVLFGDTQEVFWSKTVKQFLSY